MRDSTTKEKLSAPVAQGNGSSSLTTDFSIYPPIGHRSL